MNKFLLFVVCALFLGTLSAKEVVVKAGTIVSLEAISNVRAARVHEGQSVDFRVTKNVVVKGVTVIPQGTIAKGLVYEAKKSSWCGTKGRLGIKVRSVILPSGDELFFASSDIYITGKNRTALAITPTIITAGFLFPTLFICGSKAEMKAGYEFDAPIASTSTINIEE